MTEHARWLNLSPDDIRAHAEDVADAGMAGETGLSEAAQRAAEALRHPSTSPGVLVALAVFAETFSLLLASWSGWLAAGQTPSSALGLAALGAAVAAGLIGAAGGYGAGLLRSFWRGAPVAILAWSAVAGASALWLWSRGATATPWTLWLAGLAALLPTRAATALVVDWCVAAGLTERRAVIVGGGGNAERLIRGLEANPENDIRVVAIFDDRGDDRSPPVVAGARKLGGIADLVAFARVAHVDMLIVTLPLSAERRILRLLSALWVLPVDIRLSAYSSDFQFPRRGGEGALIDVQRRALAGLPRAMKRAMDVGVALVALALLWPVMLATAVAVRLDSPGPVIFRQMRHGYNDRAVEVWKFRSMRNDMADPTARRLVTRGDPRVTRVGRFIRRTSIDELPQLFNVLAGTLSLVGPRPHVVGAVSQQAQTFGEIVGGYSGRHRVPPGITGWAQINGWRGEIDDPEKLRKRFEHDLYYIENWSLWFDLRILFLTPFRLFGKNAY